MYAVHVMPNVTTGFLLPGCYCQRGRRKCRLCMSDAAAKHPRYK